MSGGSTKVAPRIQNMADVAHPEKLRRRFEELTRPNAENGCLEFTRLGPDGYGKMGITSTGGGSHNYRAPRVAWMLATGEMPPADAMVCHHCDNPACVRLDHLYVGDNSSNMRDMHRRGRGPKYEAGKRAGESNGNARLTWDDVSQIRSELASGRWGIKSELARRYSVNPATITLIAQGKMWREEDRPPSP